VVKKSPYLVFVITVRKLDVDVVPGTDLRHFDAATSDYLGVILWGDLDGQGEAAQSLPKKSTHWLLETQKYLGHG